MKIEGHIEQRDKTVDEIKLEQIIRELKTKFKYANKSCNLKQAIGNDFVHYTWFWDPHTLYELI